MFRGAVDYLESVSGHGRVQARVCPGMTGSSMQPPMNRAICAQGCGRSADPCRADPCRSVSETRERAADTSLSGPNTENAARQTHGQDGGRKVESPGSPSRLQIL